MQTQDLVKSYLQARQGQLSDSTLKETTRVLEKFAAANTELPQSPEPVFKFLGTMGTTVSSREKYRKLLSGFYTWASSQHDITNPMPGVKVPQRRAKVSRKDGAAAPAPNPAYVNGGGQTSAAPSLTELIDQRLAALLSNTSSGSPTAPAPSAAPPQLLTTQAVKDFVDELEHGAKPLSQRTIHTYYMQTLKRLQASFQYLPMDGNELGRFVGTGITKNQCYQFSRSLIYFYKTLGRIYSWRRKGIFNPIEEMQRVQPDYKVVIPLQADELEKMLELIRLEDHETRAMLLLMLTTGVRPVEVVALRTTDFYGMQIWVSGKTKRRQVSLLPPLKELLAALHPLAADSLPVFARVQTKDSSHSVDWWLEKVMRAAGVREGKGGGRLIRHTFACWLYSEVNDPFLVQGVLGHTTLEMSRHYAKMRMPRTAEAPLWYELIKAAAACHKMELPVISDQLLALIDGAEYRPQPLFRTLSTAYQQQTDPAIKNKSHHKAKKSSLVQATFDEFMEVDHGQTPELARSQ